MFGVSKINLSPLFNRDAQHTKVLVCKQACRRLAVQQASHIAPGKGGTPGGGAGGEGRGEHTRTGEKRGNEQRE